MRLSVHHHPGGASTAAGRHVVYDIEANAAHFGAASVDGPALVWQLGPTGDPAALSAEVDLDPSVEWLMRCDRVDFPTGGIAHRHIHPGPGIRVVLQGGIRIESEGAVQHHGPFEPWFESGPEPVFAQASDREPTAFVRVMVLPREWEGRRTISYVDPADADKPKTQTATVFGEWPITL